MRILTLVLLVATFTLAANKQTVSFRWFMDNGDNWIQPVLPMKIKVEYVSGPKHAQPDFAQCQVYNPSKSDEDSTPGARFDCDGEVYRIVGLAFEPNKE
jgi:hypothetical protein